MRAITEAGYALICANYSLCPPRAPRPAWSCGRSMHGAALSRIASPPITSQRCPPPFITAGTGDEDVQPHSAKALARTTPRATMKTFYYLPRDFARDMGDFTRMQAYHANIAPMEARGLGCRRHAGNTKRYTCMPTPGMRNSVRRRS